MPLYNVTTNSNEDPSSETVSLFARADSPAEAMDLFIAFQWADEDEAERPVRLEMMPVHIEDYDTMASVTEVPDLTGPTGVIDPDTISPDYFELVWPEG